MAKKNYNKEMLKREFEQLRYDDKDFEKMYGKKEFRAWLKDHGLI